MGAFRPPQSLPVSLELSDISKTYRGKAGEVRALTGVDLRVAAGEFLAIEGKSGCGKSTLLLVAGAMLAPDRGRVQVAGQDPYALSSEARARFRATNVGFVFQQFHLVPYLSVLENALAPSLAVEIPDARRRAEELLERFGLGPRRGHLPSELSTGERQRTALARALLAKPALLLADEPTGNLDPESAGLVLAALAEFAQNGGSVLLVTHDAQAAARAGRVLRLESGALSPK